MSLRECVVCGCQHLSDEINAKDAHIATLEARVTELEKTTGEPMRDVPTDPATILAWARGPGPRCRATVSTPMRRAMP